MNRRGAYAKGVAKREEILETALAVIAREGLRRTSIRELAEAVGLSQAGLLHYFDSKEALYTAILRKRDEVDIAAHGTGSSTEDDADNTAQMGGTAGSVSTFLDIIRHNTEVPGLVQLFAQLAVDAADPSHPAHDFFLDRRANLRERLVPALAALQAEGLIVNTISPESLATIVHALADGLQTHWLIEPDLDMAGTIAGLLAALDPTAGTP